MTPKEFALEAEILTGESAEPDTFLAESAVWFMGPNAGEL